MKMFRRSPTKNDILQKYVKNWKLKLHFSDDDFILVKTIVGVLNPVKITLEALCRRDMDLCKADAALSFILNPRILSIR